MSSPYIRFMNGNMPFWDFVSEMGGQQWAQPSGDDARQGRRHRGPPFGANPFASSGFGAAGWSPFDVPGQYGAWGQDIPFHPHSRRHHGRHEHYGHSGQEEGIVDAQNDGPSASARNGNNSNQMERDDTVTVQGDDSNEKNTGKASDEVPDPEISTPVDAAAAANKEDETPSSDSCDSGSDSDSGPDHHGRGCPWRRHRHEWSHHGHGRGGFGRGGRDGHARHPHHRREHPHRFPGRGGPWGRGRGGAHQGPHGHGPFGGFGGPRGFGRRGPHPHARGNASGLDDIMRAFASDPRLQGLGDTIGNVLRAAGAIVDPASQTHNQTRDQTDANNVTTNQTGDEVDFSPVADIYDTPSKYIVHVVLPGVNKDDVSLSWDANTSELRVAGVVGRDVEGGDTVVTENLALAEREVGVFERALKLGTHKVKDEDIEARMENGILIVNVPKLAHEDESWHEVKNVDIE